MLMGAFRLLSAVFDVNGSNPVHILPSANSLSPKTCTQHLVIAVDAVTGFVDILFTVIFVVVLIPARPGSPG